MPKFWPQAMLDWSQFVAESPNKWQEEVCHSKGGIARFTVVQARSIRQKILALALRFWTTTLPDFWRSSPVRVCQIWPCRGHCSWLLLLKLKSGGVMPGMRRSMIVKIWWEPLSKAKGNVECERYWRYQSVMREVRWELSKFKCDSMKREKYEATKLKCTTCQNSGHAPGRGWALAFAIAPKVEVELWFQQLHVKPVQKEECHHARYYSVRWSQF